MELLKMESFTSKKMKVLNKKKSVTKDNKHQKKMKKRTNLKSDNQMRYTP